jgi:hypothetical protein
VATKGFSWYVVEQQLHLPVTLKADSLLMLYYLLPYSSTVKMEATWSSEMSVYFHHATSSCIPKCKTLHSHCCDSLKSNIAYWCITNGNSCSLFGWLSNIKDGSRTFLWNVGKLYQITWHRLRRQHRSQSPSWEAQITLQSKGDIVRNWTSRIVWELNRDIQANLRPCPDVSTEGPQVISAPTFRLPFRETGPSVSRGWITSLIHFRAQLFKGLWTFSEIKPKKDTGTFVFNLRPSARQHKQIGIR